MPLLKKRKVEDNDENQGYYSEPLLSDVDAEISLEISLRKRLVDTLESRIAWAAALKEILHQQAGGNTSPETVRNVALDTLRVIEAPSDLLLCHDPPPPFPPKPIQSIRLPPRRLSLNTATAKSKPSFLFIRSSTLDLPLEGSNGTDRATTTYLLKCPTCSKTSFTSLQGLLNHARLVHNLEWGTHEECIYACAVPDNNLDVKSGTQVGLGPTGVLPGLRNIFQMAVCGRNAKADLGTILESSVNDAPLTKPPLSTLTNSLNQTLGLHDESPALALFLGKDPIRRQIKVTDEHVDVDIEGGIHYALSTQRWRMPFAHRHSNLSSLPGPEPQNIEESPNVEPSDVEKSHNFPSMSNHTTVSANSRFHLVSRIIITDRSLWIPPEERTPEHQMYTHKWMISIDSPSYAHHITSVLNSIQVTPADSTLHIPVPPPKTSPPFVVLGLADKGFLAKITLSFSGLHSQVGLPLSEQTFVFEHWVDLYSLKEPHIIKGQDQVVDIELDKDTIIRAPRRDYKPMDTRSLWNLPFETAPTPLAPPKTDQPDHPTEKYEESLAEIAKRFPMTIEDFKGKRNKLPRVPYMLANSVKHLLTFVTGRRKAIEWGRSRAIHEAYTQSLAESFHLDLPVLTVADVYSWLSENGHFPRPNHGPIQPMAQQPAKNSNDAHTNEDVEPIWCRFCGLDVRLHGSNICLPKKEEDREDKVPPTEGIDAKGKLQVASDSGCPIVGPGLQITRFPRIDVKRFVLPGQLVARGVNITFNRRSLLAAADPSMVQCIHKLTKQWKLDTFHAITSEQSHAIESSTPETMPIEQFGRNHNEIETHLAPHALLSLLTKQLICALVSRGLDVSNRDKAKAFSAIPPRRRNEVMDLVRMLTPTHVLSGVVTRGLGREVKRHAVDAPLLFGLSRLGVAVGDGDGDQGRSVSKVKVEEAT